MRRKREAEVREARETAARLRRQAIERLRRIPGLERFGGDPDFEEIAEAVSSECPLVFMAATDRGSLALIVRREESAEPAVEPLWLDDFSWRTARELADEWRRSQGHAADVERTLDRTLIALGSVMTPIVSRLVDLGASRAVLLPAGYLALLPLHAARTGGNGQAHYLLDSLEVTYAPSARAVAVLRSEARRRKARDRSFCAIGDPRPADMPLPFAHEEVSGASRLFDPDSVTLLFEASASIGPVLEAAAKATHVHFACHCVVDWTEPLHSRLELAGDIPLLLRDVIYQHAGAWNVASLVVVSACQSGAPDVARPDEAIGWPSAFLLAGVPNVIAAQWPVDDVSTALLMPRFYELLAGCKRRDRRGSGCCVAASATMATNRDAGRAARAGSAKRSERRRSRRDRGAGRRR